MFKTFLKKYNIIDEVVISSFDESLNLYADLIASDTYDENHSYIFIDEYQDINSLQENIIYNLYCKYCKNSQIYAIMFCIPEKDDTGKKINYNDLKIDQFNYFISEDGMILDKDGHEIKKEDIIFIPCCCNFSVNLAGQT